MRSRTEVLLLCLLATHAAAQAVDLKAEAPPATLEYHPAIDVPVTAVAAVAGVAMVVFRPQLAPHACRWCERSPDGVIELNSFDVYFRDHLRWKDTESPRVFGDAFGYFFVPGLTVAMNVTSALLGAGWKQALEDFLIVGEAVALAHVAEQALKLSTARARPSVLYRPGAREVDNADPSDNYSSFVAGHATVGFTLAFANGTVATMRGYRWAPAVWVLGLAAASVSSYLRIAADRHFMTDVLGGVALGALFGVGVPLLHGKSSKLRELGLSVAPSVGSGSYGLAFSGRF